MPSKKKALSKSESNKLYLARKAAKTKAAAFEAALGAPPAVNQAYQDAIEPKLLIHPDPVSAGPSGTFRGVFIEEDDFNEFAPLGQAPAGWEDRPDDQEAEANHETSGSVHPIIAEVVSEMIAEAVIHGEILAESAESPALQSYAAPEAVVTPAVAHSEGGDPNAFTVELLDMAYLIETIRQLVDAITFLKKKVKNLPPKDQTILTLRIERANKLVNQLKK